VLSIVTAVKLAKQRTMQNQHYEGLIADWYDDWLRERKDDVDYYSSTFRGFGGRILELACGTGRLLLPIAGSGVTIEGLDSSRDMLNVLQRKAEKLGLKEIKVHNLRMENFDLAARYDAVFVASGSFQLLTSKEDALNSLRCVRRCLSDTGFFLTDIFLPWTDIAERKRDYYVVTRDAIRQDGSRSIVLERFNTNISEQIKHGIYRYEFYSQRQLIACILDDLSIRWYWKDEFSNLLSEAGFSKVEILTDSPLYQEGHSFVFKALR
jgi:SAM-dependent methyltransferase